MTATATPRLFDRLRALAAEVNPVVKHAADTPGTTNHPSDNVDNNTTTASEGERSSENSSDVKAGVGTASVDSTSENPGGSQDAMQPNTGTTQAATGEDPSAEDAYKERKDDPGTSHPAQAGIGEKYASAVTFAQKRTVFSKLANDLLADIAVSLTSAAPAAAPATKEAAAPQAAAPVTTPAQSFLAGYELAKQAGATQEQAQGHVGMVLEDTMRDALHCADLVGTYLHKYAAVDPESAGNDSTGAADTGAGGDSNTGAPVGDTGGDPGGAAPPMANPAAMGGEPAPEAAMQELLAALAELGITPDQLLAMLEAEQGGGAPGGAPAMPPPDAAAGVAPPDAATADVMKMAKAAQAYQRTGKWSFKAADAGTANRKMRDELKSCLLELVGR